jgi:hypothetical protein
MVEAFDSAGNGLSSANDPVVRHRNAVRSRNAAAGVSARAFRARTVEAFQILVRQRRFGRERLGRAASKRRSALKRSRECFPGRVSRPHGRSFPGSRAATAFRTPTTRSCGVQTPLVAETREPPSFDGGSVWFRRLGCPSDFRTRRPGRRPGRRPPSGLRERCRSRGGVIHNSSESLSPVRAPASPRAALFRSIAPLRRPPHHRVRVPLEPKLERLLGLPHRARSVLAVPPGLDGFLRGRSFRIVGAPQVCCALQPAMGFARFRSPTATPRKLPSPDPSPLAHTLRSVPLPDSGPIVTAVPAREGWAFTDRANPPKSPFRPRDVSVRGQSMLPWAFGMLSGVAPVGAFPLALIEPTTSRSRQRARPWTCPLR